jgi:hypothetical protein
MKKNAYKNGFTLIETLIYLALYMIIVFGAVSGVYTIFESNARNQTSAMVEEEGAFMIGKIDWALADAQSVSIPAAGTTNSQLTVMRYDGKSVIIALSGTNVTIQDQEGTNALEQLNNTNITISNLVFSHTTASQNGISPESIKASFAVSAKTAQGQAFTRDFSTLKYLRK